MKVKKNLLFSFDPKQNSSMNENENDEFDQTSSFYKRSESSDHHLSTKQSDCKNYEININPIDIEYDEKLPFNQSKQFQKLEISKESDKENSISKQHEDEELTQMIETHKKRKKFNLKSIAIKLERSHSENVEDNPNLDEVCLQEIKLNTDKNSKRKPRTHADQKYK